MTGPLSGWTTATSMLGSLRNLYRYMRDFNALHPALSPQDLDVLRGLQVLERKIPFPILRVPAGKLLDHIGVSYAHPAHYHRRALDRLDIGEQILAEHFSRFRPGSLGEVLVAAGELGNRLSGYSRWYFAGGMPWSTLERFRTVEQVEGEQSCAHFGPCTDEFIAWEWQRLADASARIARHGYRPFRFVDGFIRGFIIHNGADYNFIVTAGKHRAAAVCSTQDEVLVRLDWNDFLPVVSRDHAERLPLVRSGVYEAQVARDLIDYYSTIGFR